MIFINLEKYDKKLEKRSDEQQNDDRRLAFAYADDAGLAAGSPAKLQKSIDIWCKVLTYPG